MSLPRDLLDQLLSGYLDDALSVDERQRVESLLEQDQQVAREFAELQELRQTVRELADSGSLPKLGDGFAEQVLAAAVLQAQAEGLSKDHPLLRMTDQPSTHGPGGPIARGDSSRLLRTAGLLIGLATSIVIAVLVFRPTGNEVASNPTGAIANVGTESSDERVVDTDPADPVDTLPANPLLASEDLEATADRAPDGAVAAPQVARSDAADENARVAIADTNRAVAPPPSVVDDPTGRTAAPTSASEPAADIQLGAILVLDVRLTPIGQMEDAVRDAMISAGLDAASEKELPDQLVGHLQDNTDAFAGDQQVSVIYLQAPARQLDRFYLALLADKTGVEAVGMSLAMNAPILKVVESIAVDPTTVRHSGSSVELSSDSGAVDQLAGELSRLQFAPLNRQAAGAAMSPSGPDVPSQILVLVR